MKIVTLLIKTAKKLDTKGYRAFVSTIALTEIENKIYAVHTNGHYLIALNCSDDDRIVEYFNDNKKESGNIHAVLLDIVKIKRYSGFKKGDRVDVTEWLNSVRNRESGIHWPNIHAVLDMKPTSGNEISTEVMLDSKYVTMLCNLLGGDIHVKIQGVKFPVVLESKEDGHKAILMPKNTK